MMSSTTPPSSSQHNVYWALPGWMRPRSLVRHRLTKSAAPCPRTSALPRWLTSKTPTPSRTAASSDDVFGAHLKAMGFKGEPDQIVTFPAGDLAPARLVVAVAVPAKPTTEQLRRLAGSSVRTAVGA